MIEKNKHTIIKGMAWTGIERLVTMLVQFIISLIIARILTPFDYGLIGMLAIFIGIAQTFIDSGFTNALIQKKDRNNIDYSTTFYFSIIVALIIYLILFFCAPLIASFYNQPMLIEITRVYMTTLIFNSLIIVPSAIFTINMDFKIQAIISLVSLLLSGTLGILLAYKGFEVWALVYQGIIGALGRIVLMGYFCKWRPSKEFSFVSFKKLFSFGGKLLGASLINNIYSNLSTLIIGKAFHASELGYFTRANQFCQLPTTTITNMVIKVNYPVLAKYQDENKKLIKAYTQMLRTPLYILYPILFLISALAYPMISVILGKKWLFAASLIPILSFGFLWEPLTHINLNLLYVKGRTDLVLKLEFIKKPVAFILLIGSISFGIKMMCWAISLYSLFAFCFNCYYTGKFLNYGIYKQLKSIINIFIYCILMTIVVCLTILIIPNDFYKLILGGLIGIISYILISSISKDHSYIIIKNLFLKFKRKNMDEI